MILIKKYWYWIVIIILSGALIYEKVYDYNTEKYYQNCLKEYLQTMKKKFSKEEIIESCMQEKFINSNNYRKLEGLTAFRKYDKK